MVKVAMRYPVALVLLVPFLAIAPAPVLAQAVMGTAGDGDLGLIFPSPALALPSPFQTTIAGFPVDAAPHGVDYFGTDNALLSDFGGSRMVNVQVSTRTVVLSGRPCSCT